MGNAQDSLFHEDIYSALAHLVDALGGTKKVGAKLYPSMPVDQAGRKVAHCLNTEHAQQFHPHEILFLLAEGRRIGVHSAMAHINRDAGYDDPRPVEPEDEAALLQRQFIQSVETQKQILSRLERLQPATTGGRSRGQK